jgi:hypothetical protein
MTFENQFNIYLAEDGDAQVCPIVLFAGDMLLAFSICEAWTINEPKGKIIIWSFRPTTLSFFFEQQSSHTLLVYEPKSRDELN